MARCEEYPAGTVWCVQGKDNADCYMLGAIDSSDTVTASEEDIAAVQLLPSSGVMHLDGAITRAVNEPSQCLGSAQR